jgi:tetratricopeptide (TPR) repeat protein
MELYLKKGDDRQAQTVQEQLEQSSNLRKLKEKFPEEGFRAENYIALQWMKQGRYKEALKKYRNLQTETTMHYQYRFEGIPVVHDIFRNMATCESKLNNHKEALNLLNSTKDWQLVCEGESAGLALT